MAQKVNKTLEALRSQAPLDPGEEYVGAFMSRSKIKWRWFFVIGPLATLTMKQYQVMVTSRRVVFGRLSLMGTLAAIDQFTFNEIESVSFKKGMLTYTIKFKFKNGRSLNLTSNHKAPGSLEGFLFEPKIEQYLTKAIV